jgi:hypothetical protein
MSPVNRRTFLSAVVAGVGGLVATARGAGALVLGSAPANVATATPSDLVGGLFSDAGAVGRIGSTYLQLAPTEASEAALLPLLAPEDEDPTEWWASIDGEELQTEIRRRSHADFKTPDVVDIAGWQLARTECRLAALWVVTHP